MARAKSRAKRRLSTPSRFDGEALGLVLFALGIFLSITVALPVGGTPNAAGEGFMSLANRALLGWGGWGAYLLPLVPLCFGVLVFLGHDLRNLTRRVVGGVITVLSLLCLHELIAPEGAGELAARAVNPLFVAVGYFAALLPLLTLTLGVEVFLSRPSFSLAKSFARLVSLGALALFGASREALEARRDGQDRSRARAELRGALQNHLRDLAALETLYPESKELGAWKAETKRALRDLPKLDEDAHANAAKDLATWSELTRNFTAVGAKDLHAAVVNEAPELALTLEECAQDVRKGRHDLAHELHATLASAALERVRRALSMDLMRLAARAAALERDRKRAEKALESAAAKGDAETLAREWPKHRARVKDWAEFSARAQEWQERAALYTPWPTLARRYDHAPAELASALAASLENDPDGTLRECSVWEAKLSTPRADTPPAPQAAALGAHPILLSPDADVVAPLVTSIVAPPLIDLDFSDFGGVPQSPLPAVPARPVPSVAVAARQDTPPWEEEDPDLAEAGAFSAPTAPGASVTKPPEHNPNAPTFPAGAFADGEKPRSVASQGAIDIARPDFDLLDPIPAAALNTASLDAMARSRADLINQTLAHFNLQAKVVDYARGPTVTRYEIEPAPGEKISRIASLSNDLARALAVGGVRVEAPVPGKSVIGLEVPNAEREPVTFHAAAANPSFRATRAKLPIILGKSIDGEMLVGDLAKMPHLLIAGSTGSGKSVCVNTLIVSLLYRYLPTELRFLMVDPKMVELTPYDGIPHLVRGVVTNPADAAGVLLGAVAHMERRYKMMSQVGAKNLEQYNAKMRQVHETELPHLVVIIDELADLMITAPKEVESAIMRLAQMARATGMHLVLATQRPSVDILTSLIKVNVPARIAFAVSSSHDSRTILDAVGAERLTGMGDMLFYQPGLVKPQRLQGPYISENETARITEFLRRQVFEDWFGETYGADFDGLIGSEGVKSGAGGKDMDFSDPFLRQAAEICIEEGQGSVSRLQRRLSVGHARAGKLMDMLEAMGIVSKHQGSKPRDVLITRDDLPEYFGR